MGPIVAKLKKDFGGKITLVTFNADVKSEEDILKKECINRLPTLRFINSKNEITAELIGVNKRKIMMKAQRLI